MNNTQKLPRNVFFAISLGFLGIIVLSAIIAIHPAMVFLSIFLSLTGFFVGLLFQARYRCLQKMIEGHELIASWIFDDAVVLNRQKEIEKEREGSVSAAFYGLSFFAILIMVIVAVATAGDFNAGYIVAIVIVLIDITYYQLFKLLGKKPIKEKANQDKLTKKLSRNRFVYIHKDGIYAHGLMHMWRGWGSKLKYVVFNEDSCTFYFTYSYISGYIVNTYTIDLEVPEGNGVAIRQIMDAFEVVKQ